MKSRLQFHTQGFLDILVHICTVYRSETQLHPPWLGTLSENVLEFRVSRLKEYLGLKCTSQADLRSFYKPGSEKFGLNIWEPIPIQRYENTSTYDTGLYSNHCISFYWVPLVAWVYHITKCNNIFYFSIYGIVIRKMLV